MDPLNFFASAEAAVRPQPEPAAAGSLPAFFRSAEDPVGAAVGRLAKDGTEWEKAAPQLAEAAPGADAKVLERQYRSAVAREKYAESRETGARYFLRRSIPGFSAGFALGEGIKTARAKARIEAGTATQDDYDELAQRERLEEIDRQRTTGQAVASAAARLPAILGEAVVGGGAVRAGLSRLGAGAIGTTGGAFRQAAGQSAVTALATPLMPSTYLDQAAKRAEQQGGEWYDLKNLGVAGANAVVQNALLGHSMKLAGRVPGLGATKLGRGVAGAPIGMTEQAGADVAVSWLEEKYIPAAYQTRTRYGLLGNLARGERGEAMKAAATQALTFGFFAGLQPGGRGLAAAPKKEYDRPNPGPAFVRQATGGGATTGLRQKMEARIAQQIAADFDAKAAQGKPPDVAAAELAAEYQKKIESLQPQKPTSPTTPGRPAYQTQAVGSPVNVPRRLIPPEAPTARPGAEVAAPSARGVPPAPEPAPSEPATARRMSIKERLAAMTARKVDETAQPGVLTQVVSAAGLTRRLPGDKPSSAWGKFLSYDAADPKDNLTMSLRYRPEDNAVGLDFKYENRGGGLAEQAAAPPKAVALQLARDLQTIAEELHGRGVAIEYKAESKRHAAYGRQLEKVGYELKRADAGEEFGSYRWEPKVDAPAEPPPGRRAEPDLPTDARPDAIVPGPPPKAPEPPPPAPPPKATAFGTQRKKKTKTGESLLAVINKKFGGIDPEGVEFLGEFRSGMGKDFGWPPGLLRKGGKGLDELAAELHNEGVINAPDPNTRVAVLADLLRRPNAQTVRGVEKGVEAAAEAAARADQLARDQDLWDALTAAERKLLKSDDPETYKRMTDLGVDFKTKPGGGAVRPESLRGPREGMGELSPDEARVIDALDNIRDRDRDIIKAVLGGDSLEAAAGRHSLTKERVRQIAETAYRKLQAADPEVFPDKTYRGAQKRIVDRSPLSEEAREALLQREERLARQGNLGEDQPGRFLPTGTRGKTFDLFANPIPQAIDALKRGAAWMARSGWGAGRVPFQFDAANPNPRPMPPADFKAAVTTPEGMGRVPVLARLFDPRGTDRTPEGVAIMARQALKYMGDSWAALWAQTNKPTTALWETDAADGTIKLTNGKWGYLADFAEAELRRPGSQPLTQPQRDWLHKVYKPLAEDLRQFMRDEQVGFFLDQNGDPIEFDQHYFPRPAVGKKDHGPPSGPGQPPRGPAQPGTKGSFLKKRKYATEEEGAKDGIVYDPDPVSRVAKLVAGVYRAVADHRLVMDPALRGEPLKDQKWLENRPIRGVAAFEPYLVRKVQDGEVKSFMQGRVYPPDVAAKVEAYYQSQNPGVIQRGIATANDFMKALSLGFDASVLFNQMLSIGLMGTYKRKPIGQKAWAKGLYSFVRSAFDPQAMSKYLARPENQQAAREMVQAGSNIGRLSDFLAGMEQGQPAARLPVVGKGVEWSGRTFGAAVDTVKLELWKSLRDAVPPEQRLAVMQRIDAAVGSGRMEAAGVTPARALGERLLFLAPSLYRAGLEMASGLAQRGVAGQLARRAVGGQITATAVLAYAAAKALGLDDDELTDRFDPRSGKFLTVPITLADGSTVNLRLGNILTSYARLLGDLVETQTDTAQPGRGPVNVLRDWYRTHSSPAVRAGWEAATEADPFGRPAGRAETAAKAVTPIAGQDILYGDRGLFGPKGMRQAEGVKAGVSLLGVQAMTTTAAEERRRAVKESARTLFGKPPDQLTFKERAEAIQAVDDRLPPRDADPQARAFGARAEAQRREELYDSLSGGAKTRLAEAGFGPNNLPPHEAAFSVNSVSVPLTPAERKKYAGYVAREYEAALEGLPDLSAMSEQKREDRVRKALEQAREKAREQVKKEAGR